MLHLYASSGRCYSIKNRLAVQKVYGDVGHAHPSPGETGQAAACRIPEHLLEVTEWNKNQQLRENRLPAIHGVASYAKKTGNDTGQKPLAISNRRNRESRQNPRQCWIAAK